MTSLLTADGRLLRKAGPSGSFPVSTYGFGGGGSFDGVWTDRSEDEGETAALISYSTIYETQPVVAAAVNKLTRQGSTLPLKVYRRNANGDKERVTSGSLVDLLSSPLPRRGPVHLKQWVLMPLLTHGNAILAKYREEPDGPPTALLPVDWTCVEAYAPQGGYVEWWATTQTGQQRWLRAEDTIHFAWESPNGEIGVSPLKQLTTTIQIEDAGQRYQRAMFKNSARPTGAIEVPEPANGKPLPPEIRAEMRADIDRLFSGIENAGRPVLLQGGAAWKAMSHTAHEAQLIAQRKLNREEIAMVYDLPGPLIGDLEHGTYSNVTELNKQLYKSVLRPWLTLKEETIQAQLIDPEPEWEGLFVEFDMGEVLRGSKVEEIAAAASSFTNGLMTLNEVRSVLNLPRVDIPAADQPHIPANNMQPLGADGPALPAGPEPSAPDA